MKTLYTHVHLVIDDKREYLDGSILINNEVIEDVFVQSNKTINNAKVINMQNNIFIPAFFDTKSKTKKQKEVAKRFVCSNKVTNEPTHLRSDTNKFNKNILALTRIKSKEKGKKIKTLFDPSMSMLNINKRTIQGISDITQHQNIDFKSDKLINYAIGNNCFVEFGIDNKISNEYIKFILKNIDPNKIMLISYKHDDIINQIRRLKKLNTSWTDIVSMTSINPNKFYGSKIHDGYLIKGKPANIICLNKKLEVLFVLNKGEKNA